jgi:hypothetical protein
MQAAREKDDAAARDSDSNVYRSEKLQAITSLEFKRSPPTIQDTDPDLNKYDMLFENCITCYAFGGRKIRDVDKLFMYGNGFDEGSTRRKVYDNVMRAAVRAGRVPEDSLAVLVEVKKELRTYIWETTMQKQVRLDQEFEMLAQGGMSHADYRALWESKLQDLQEAGMDLPTETTLYRKYLMKLNASLRTRVLSKEWKLDGPDLPTRPLKTYKDVGIACSLALEEKADIHCTGDFNDSYMAILPQSGQRHAPQGGGKGASLVCGYCNAEDNHYSVVCPQRAADWRGDAKDCAAASMDHAAHPSDVRCRNPLCCVEYFCWTHGVTTCRKAVHP